MATDMLNHLLAHHLATNQTIPPSLNYLCSTLETQRLIARTEQEEGTSGPTLHRWQLRLVSLLAASNPSPVRAAGFQLLHHTFTSSSTFFLAASKQTLTAAQQVLAAPISKVDPTLYLAAVEVAKLIIAKSTWYPEWARDNVGAQTVQKFVSTMVQAVNESASLQAKLASVSTICTLLPLFPTALRPLSPSLHTLSLSLLCDVTCPRSLQDAASSLFVSLYLLAPKGKEGLREAWKTGVEALIASCDGLVSVVTGGIFAEDDLTNPTLAPLALPPLEGDPQSPFPALERLETLARVLLKTLRTPTTEKAGEVSIPLGALVELGVRMVGFNRESPTKERVDPTVHTLVLSVVPKIEILGCQLLAQIGLCVGTKMVGFSNVVLGTVARTLSTYEVRSPMRPALATTYSLLVSSFSSHVDPNEGAKSLSRVWRSVLEDISSVALEPLNVNVTTSEKTAAGKGGKQQEGRKNKRVKTSFDPTESMVDTRAAVDERDLDIAIKGLETLERLLRAPFSQFLPPALQLATSRLLLYISLSPSFSTIAPLSTRLQTSTFYPASTTSSNSSPLEIVKHSLPFKLAVLRALQTSVSHGIGGVGVEERSLSVWKSCSLSSNEQIQVIGLRALHDLGKVCHPKLPIALENENLGRLRRDKKGGEVGSEEADEMREELEEFRRRDAQVGEYRDEEDEEEKTNDRAREDQDMEDHEETRQRKQPTTSTRTETVSSSFSTAANGSSSLSSTTTSTTNAAGGGGSNGFASFQAPSFGSPVVAPPTVPSVSAPEQKETPTPAPELSFSTETVVSKPNPSAPEAAKVATATRSGDGDDSDSDDDMMPAIDVGSDEE